MIEPAVRSILIGDEPVKALVGERVYFGIGPQDERRPRVVVTTTSEIHYHTLDGEAGYTTGNIQIDALAPSYKEAKVLCKAVVDAVDDFTGAVAGMAVEYIEVDETADMPVEPLEGRAVPTFGVSIDARFMTVGEDAPAEQQQTTNPQGGTHGDEGQ